MKMSARVPQIILYNGILATQNTAQPSAQAVAVGGGKILVLGQDDQVLKLAGPDTEKIDLDGRLVVPGFIDSHIHFYEWALKRQGIKIDDLGHLEALLDRVREAQKLESGKYFDNPFAIEKISLAVKAESIHLI